MVTQSTNFYSKMSSLTGCKHIIMFYFPDHGFWDYLEAGRLEWPDNTETKEEWRDRMEKDGEYADHIMMQLTANVLNRDIIFHHVIR